MQISKRHVILHILTFVWMILIFYFSAQDGQNSSRLSSEVSKYIAQLLTPVFSAVTDSPQLPFIDDLQYIVRKGAHVSLYFILGILTMSAMLEYKIKTGYKVLLAFAVVVLYAASDEMHQYFIPGRAAMFGDVMFDTAGSSAGILAALGLRNIMRRRRLAPPGGLR